MAYAQARGCRVYYERHGQGPAVVFCHGAGSNAATWWQQIPFFSNRFTCLTLDHRGFGRSLAPPESLSWDALSADVLAVLDAEQIDRAALVCQSLGGGIGLRFTLEHPDRVWALVSSGSPLGIDAPAVLASVERYLGAADGKQVEQRALAPAFRVSETALAFLYQQINAFNPLVSGGMSAEFQRQLRALNHPDAVLDCSRLAAVACPVLLVSGALDPLVPPDLALSMARYFANARMVAMNACGHSPYFERPAAFNHQVGRFLEACVRDQDGLTSNAATNRSLRGDWPGC